MKTEGPKAPKKGTSRRAFLASSLTSLSVGFLAGSGITASTLRQDDLFTLGVASGYPTSNSVVLWTRLALLPLEPGGGMTPAPIPVQWEIATDENMRRVVQRGTEYAQPEWAHS